jgi:hypothetical protein
VKFPAELRPEQVVAIVDTREPNPVPIGLPYEIATLNTADFGLKAMPGLCAYESKTEDDLLAFAGINRPRADREIERMLAFPCRGIVAQTTWDRLEAGHWRSKVTPSAVIGSLLGWGSMGIPIYLVANRERAGQLISRLLFIAARREYRKLRGLLLPQKEPATLSRNAYPPETIDAFCPGEVGA